MKIAIFNDKNRLYGKLCKWATGLADFHIGFTDEVHFWDQQLLFRKRNWMPRTNVNITLFECPFEITPEELDLIVMSNVEQICANKKLSTIISNVYGIRDYSFFALKKLGIKSSINFPGVVCSGRFRDIAYSKGWSYLGKPTDMEPSPADCRRKLIELNVPVHLNGNMD